MSKLYQHPYVNVLKFATTTSDPQLKLKKEGDVQEILDKYIGKKILRIWGAIPANNYIECPTASAHSLGLVGSYIYTQLRVSQNLFIFHFDVQTKDDLSVRVSFSNLFKNIKATQKTIQIPTDFLRPQKWTVLVINIASIINENLRGRTFKCLKGFQFCANLYIRSMLTSDTIYNHKDLPRDMFLPVTQGRSWEELYDWRWYPAPPAIIAPLPAEPAVGTENSHSDMQSPHTPPLTVPNRRAPLEKHQPQPTTSYLTPDPILQCAQVIGYSGMYSSNLLWAPDGKHIIYPSYSVIVVMDPQTREQRFMFGHTENICALVISHSLTSYREAKTLIASAQEGKSPLIRLWDYATGKCVGILKGHHSDIACLCFSHNGNVLCGVGKDKHGRYLIILWDTSDILKTGKAPIIIKQFSDYNISRIAFVPLEDSKLVSCGRDNIRFWRIKGGVLRGCALDNKNISFARQNFLDLAFEQSFSGPIFGGISAAHRLYASTESGAVFQIDYSRRIIEYIYQLHNGPIHSLAVNEGICVTGSDDKLIRVWPLDFSNFILEAEHESAVTSVRISDDGLKVAVGTPGGTLGVLDIATQRYQTSLRSHISEIIDLALDPHNRECTTISKDCTIRVWDLDTFDQLYQFDIGVSTSTSPAIDSKHGPMECPRCVTYHPMDYVIACGFDSGAVRIFDIKKTKVIAEYQTAPSYYNGDAIGPGVVATQICKILYTRDFRWLISASRACLCIADTQRGYQPIKVFNFLSLSERVAMATSPNGRLLAVLGPSGNVVHLYNTDANHSSLSLFEEVKQLEIASILNDLCFSPDSKELVVMTSDSSIIRIDLATAKPVKEIPQAHKSPSRTLAVSSNGNFISSGGDDGIIKIWEYHVTGSMEPFQAFVGHSAPINRVQFSLDSRLLVSVGGGSLLVWNFMGDTTGDLSQLLDEYIQDKSAKAREEEGATVFSPVAQQQQQQQHQQIDSISDNTMAPQQQQQQQPEPQYAPPIASTFNNNGFAAMYTPAQQQQQQYAYYQPIWLTQHQHQQQQQQ